MVMRFYSIGIYLFLYVPIGIIVLFSFNSGRHASDFQGFSVEWYGKALSNVFVIESLTTSLIIALSAATLSSLMGTAAALALQQVRGRLRALFDSLIYVSIIIPGIVIGIATLVALVTVFDLLNPILGALWPRIVAEAQIGRHKHQVFAFKHIVEASLFNLVFLVLSSCLFLHLKPK